MFNHTYLIDSMKQGVKVGQANIHLNTEEEVHIAKSHLCFLLDVRKPDGKWASGLKDVLIEQSINMAAQLEEIAVGEVKPVSSKNTNITNESGTVAQEEEGFIQGSQGLGFQATLESVRETLKIQVLGVIDAQFDKLKRDIPADFTTLEQSVLQKENHLNEEEAHLQEQEIGLLKLDADIDAELKTLDAQLNIIHDKDKDLAIKEKMLKAQIRRLQEQESSLQIKETDLQERKTMVQKMKRVGDQKVTLNVGGQHFVTSKCTLREHENSHLYDIISHDNFLGEKPIFIDRDGKTFATILKYLRHGKDVSSLLPDDKIELKELLIEAEYFKLDEFADIIKSALK